MFSRNAQNASPRRRDKRQRVHVAQPLVARRCVAVEVGAQPVGHMIRHTGVDVGGPVSSGSEEQPRGCPPAAALLRREVARTRLPRRCRERSPPAPAGRAGPGHAGPNSAAFFNQASPSLGEQVAVEVCGAVRPAPRRHVGLARGSASRTPASRQPGPTAGRGTPRAMHGGVRRRGRRESGQRPTQRSTSRQCRGSNVVGGGQQPQLPRLGPGLRLC